VVTALAPEVWPAAGLYAALSGGRGERENRSQEQQLLLFAERTSTATLRANQVRLYLSSVAYLLVQAIRRLGRAGTRGAQAPCGTSRQWLYKSGALVQVPVRKGWGSLSRAGPYPGWFVQVYENLHRARPTSAAVT
jgi:hypothetical protein